MQISQEAFRRVQSVCPQSGIRLIAVYLALTYSPAVVDFPLYHGMHLQTPRFLLKGQEVAVNALWGSPEGLPGQCCALCVQ